DFHVTGVQTCALPIYGLISGPLICGRTLDDPELEPLWTTLEETRFPIFVHPHYCAAVEELGGFGHALPVAVGFPFESTIAISRRSEERRVGKRVHTGG